MSGFKKRVLIKQADLVESKMWPTQLKQDIRMRQFEEIYSLRQQKVLKVEEAASLLGLSERTFRRWVNRYEEEGLAGLYDHRLDKMASNAVPMNEVLEMLELYNKRYPGLSVSHFFDKWKEFHGGIHSYNWVRTKLQQSGSVKIGKKKGKRFCKRDRKPATGMMLHQDGSTHEWVPGSWWDLIVTMDDASNEIYSMFFVEEEGTFSSLRGVREVILKHGLFCNLYTDRGRHYWETVKAGAKVNKDRQTHFRRAMERLAIEMIPAYTPEARGRSERMFRTLQARLPKELALEGITQMNQANIFLRDIFLASFNKRFKVKPQCEESAFVPWRGTEQELEDILCWHEERVVAKDNTVSYKAMTLQLPADANRFSYNRAKVRVHEYAEGGLAIFYGPRCLVRFSKAELTYKTGQKSGKYYGYVDKSHDFPTYPQQQQDIVLNLIKEENYCHEQA